MPRESQLVTSSEGSRRCSTNKFPGPTFRFLLVYSRVVYPPPRDYTGKGLSGNGRLGNLLGKIISLHGPQPAGPGLLSA